MKRPLPAFIAFCVLVGGCAHAGGKSVATCGPSSPPKYVAVISVTEVTEPPDARVHAMLLPFASSAYPPEMALAGIDGMVRLRFEVDPNGTVSSIVVERSSMREFSTAAVRVAKDWRFRLFYDPGYSPREKLSMTAVVRFDTSLVGEPNHVPDPTSPSVTPPAGAGGAPSVTADH
jgi:TonB family protein